MSDTPTSQIALVTGASRGIGRAIAATLAAKGFTVIGTATTDAGAAAISDALAPHGGRGLRLDVNDGAAVDAAIDAIVKADGGLQVLVYCPDRPDLFARICAFFERAGYSIFDAKIYTTLKGYALDSFYVHVADGRDIDYRDLVGYIEYELAQLIIRDDPLPPPLSGRVSRVLKHFPLPPQVLIRQDDKQKLHILSLIAGDRPGLLSRIARVLSRHAIAIHSAKIMTLGERAEDTFTISGNALADPKSLVRLEADLMETLRV